MGRIADLAGAPFAILLVAVFCAGWFLRAGTAGENTLTLILSVASITLMQMVLNGQRRSEKALHLKMDELVYAMRGARNEVAGIDSESTDKLEALRRTGDAAEEVYRNDTKTEIAALVLATIPIRRAILKARHGKARTLPPVGFEWILGVYYRSSSTI